MAAPRNKEDGAPSRPRPTPVPAPAPTAAPPEDLTNLLVSSLDENPFASVFDDPIVDIPLQVKTTNTPAVDINKVIATNQYGGALPYSQLSPEDQAVVDARRAAAAAPTVEPYKGVERQSYGEAQQLTSAEEALNNYLNFFRQWYIIFSNVVCNNISASSFSYNIFSCCKTSSYKLTRIIVS